MKILFWNTHRNIWINPYLASLVQDYEADLLVTAEYQADKAELEAFLGEQSGHLVSCNTCGCGRIFIWSTYTDVSPGSQDDYYSIQIVQNSYILCCVHLPSDLYGDHSDERLEIIQRMMHDIHETEEKLNSGRTVIIGDMNEMPYAKGCLNANGLHGLPELREDDRPARVVNGTSFRKYYNPMWNLFGDFTYPPGTYYLNESRIYAPMWYLLDQVVISQEILPIFKKESLKIITSCSHGKLYDQNQHPDRHISDHFPILCEIDDIRQTMKGLA